MKIDSDKKIWNDFREGKEYALSRIYYQNVQKLFRYGQKISSNNELIKDTIQELFFDLIRTRDNLGSTDNISFYLFASFRRKLNRSYSKEKLFSDSDVKNLMEAKIVYSIEDELIEKEQLTQQEQQVQAGLKMLSAKQRQILYYKFTCDFSYEEICELMSLEYDSARKQVSRALKSLKSVLEDSRSLILLSTFLKKGRLFSK